MQPEALSQIKRQIVLLDSDSKKQLAAFLADTLADQTTTMGAVFSDKDRRLQVEWLKKNREQYAGRYVALSGSDLVGEGPTLEAAATQAKKNGFPSAFITYVYSENDEAFGGW